MVAQPLAKSKSPENIAKRFTFDPLLSGGGPSSQEKGPPP
jgi:hypothetical protein